MPRLKTFARHTGLPRRRRWAEVYQQVKDLQQRAEGAKQATAKPKAPAVLQVSKVIEALATYMARTYHDYSFSQSGNGAYYLEPGFQRLAGERGGVISVHYTNLRDDREDDCKRAFDAWGELGWFEFRHVENGATAEIVVDDEERGAYTEKNFQFVGRQHEGKWVVHSQNRRVNIFKEWPEWAQYDTFLHEIGHVIGLGHPGPYNGSRPDTPVLNGDTSSNTIMSYFGGNIGRLGEADRVAVEMIYG